jgi:branched-subunit amino acid transport protein
MSQPMPEWEMWLAVAGLVAITVLTRSFFFISNRPWALPAWVERGLKYAPLAALAAVVLPEIVLTQGALAHTWQDARLYAAPVAALWAWWRRDMLTTIGIGMAVYLLLKLGLGW